jgi:hypothetical protein
LVVCTRNSRAPNDPTFGPDIEYRTFLTTIAVTHATSWLESRRMLYDVALSTLDGRKFQALICDFAIEQCLVPAPPLPFHPPSLLRSPWIPTIPPSCRINQTQQRPRLKNRRVCLVSRRPMWLKLFLVPVTRHETKPWSRRMPLIEAIPEHYHIFMVHHRAPRFQTR